MAGFKPDLVKTSLVVTGDDETMRELYLHARMIQRVHDYFQRNIKAGNLGIPNSQSIKPCHLKWARMLQNWYAVGHCNFDTYQFPESWIKEPGALDKLLEEFDWYGGKLASRTVGERLAFWQEVSLNPEAVEKICRDWDGHGALFEDYKRKPLVWKPLAEYQTFEPVVRYEPTKEELARIERVRKESEACGSPSEQTARCFLFEMIDTDPTARAALEKQAREDPKAAFHLDLLKKKAATDMAKDPESGNRSGVNDGTTILDDEASTESINQEDAVRQMYALQTQGDDDMVFDIERAPLAKSKRRQPVSMPCPTGILIDF